MEYLEFNTFCYSCKCWGGCFLCWCVWVFSDYPVLLFWWFFHFLSPGGIFRLLLRLLPGMQVSSDKKEHFHLFFLIFHCLSVLSFCHSTSHFLFIFSEIPVPVCTNFSYCFALFPSATIHSPKHQPQFTLQSIRPISERQWGFLVEWWLVLFCSQLLPWEAESLTCPIGSIYEYEKR